MIYNPVNEVNQSNFFLLIFLKKYRKSTAVLLISKYWYRGTNFSKVPSTGTAVLLQSTVPTYACGYVGADATSSLPLRWRRLIHVSSQRKGERPPLQRPGVLAIVTFMSKGRAPMRSIGSVKQPIKLFSGLTYYGNRYIQFHFYMWLRWS